MHRTPDSRIRLLSEPGRQSGDAADFAYRHILRRIKEARRSIEIHMYVWRADAVGHLIGQAVFDAAERGVAVRILKDSGAQLFETQESNGKPFFPFRRPLLQRVTHWLAGRTFPDSFVRDDFDQKPGLRLIAHPNVDFQWVSPTHTKYYCIDDRYLITGSLNLEVRHRGYHDFMIEMEGDTLIQAFRENRHPFVRNEPDTDTFPVKPALLNLIRTARKSIHIEMAYIGDEEITQALIDAGRRGLHLSILFSKAANIGNDVNFHTLHQIMKSTTVDVRLSEKMIHSKVMVADGSRAILGSANLSVFSLQKAGELCVVIDDDPLFMRDLEQILEERWNLGIPVRGTEKLPRYSKLLARLQQRHQHRASHR